MQATTRNKLGKIEKNKKVKEGPCLFPFKFKKQTYTDCAETDKGRICATSVNPKTRTLQTYGYCQEYGAVKPRSRRSSPKRSSPKRSNKTIKKKPKRKLVLMHGSPKKPELKEKLNPNIPKESPHKQMEQIILKSSDLKASLTPKQMEQKRLNEEFISVLSELESIMSGQGEPFRAKAYREAAEAIMNYPNDLTHPDQLKGVRHIGKTILSKLNEYVNTGTLRILERERTNPLNQLTKVYGIGPKKAKDLIKQGIDSLDKLREHQELLTGNMKNRFKVF